MVAQETTTVTANIDCTDLYFVVSETSIVWSQPFCLVPAVPNPNERGRTTFLSRSTWLAVPCKGHDVRKQLRMKGADCSGRPAKTPLLRVSNLVSAKAVMKFYIYVFIHHFVISRLCPAESQQKPDMNV